jgi:protein-L-isoaspartate(D-aspartate) O-methyltransferase
MAYSENPMTVASRRLKLKILLVSLLFCLALGLSLDGAHLSGDRRLDEDALARARSEMVERDLRGRGVKDSRVLEVMARVPRHLFVDESARASAYADHPLPIGEGQTISQPYIVALMTELLRLGRGEKVLEIGTGSGYQAAVLSELAGTVYSIEIVPGLAERAKERLRRLGYHNVRVKLGDGFLGWKEEAPFDRILVTAAAAKIPEPLWEQLKEKGILVMPLGPAREVQRLVRVTKVGGRPHFEEITGVLFVPLTGAAGKDPP